MIGPSCAKCGAELMEPGGLMFSPPDPAGWVQKFHICAGCWPSIDLEPEPELVCLNDLIDWTGPGVNRD